MKPLRIRINRIVDLGTIVSLRGVDAETGEPVSIHIDHQPSGSFSEAWHAAGYPEPIEYVADRLMLYLDMRPAEDGGEARLVECDRAGVIDGCASAREVEQ
jgi:hypothetical protein